ncbi:hypothetical protein [Brevibacterium senegalense]|uniref:hypothetical protein n=1 Tax=Brevibacterium senegalense TaxID=1033736 RepID=UPI00030BE70A|nr:hypothetical protein [Brevibacterium senegalense]
MDAETLPFQVDLGYQVPRDKPGDYVGRVALEAARAALEDGRPPFSLQLAGLRTALGTRLWVWLPDVYAETPGTPVEAEVVPMPFRPSTNPNQRERLREKGLDSAA